MISCLECGVKLKHIGGHLRKHNISTKEYLQKYPLAVLVSEESKQLTSIKTKEAMSRPDVRKNFEKGIKNREPTTNNLGKFVQKGRILTEEEYSRSYSQERNNKISKARIEWWFDKKDQTIEELWGKDIGKQLRQQQSETRSGENNPAFGKVYEKTGGKIGRYKGMFFRGIWELSYWKHLESSGINIHDEKEVQYEPFRLPYISVEKKRTYTPDFLLKKDKKLIEIKSFYKVSEMSNEFQTKNVAAKEWCSQNGYTYCILTEKDFPVISYRKAYSDPDIVWVRR